MYEEDIIKCRELIDLINIRLKEKMPATERMLNEYKLTLTKKRLETLEKKQKEVEKEID